MAGLSPNSANIARTQRATQQVTHVVVHPEYQYWYPEWSKIRDALAGEREIKRKGSVYLRPLRGSESDPQIYAEYLDRAVFYNMSAQTLAGMVGQMFRRPPTVRNLPMTGAIVGRGADDEAVVLSPASDKFSTQLNRFAKDGTSHIGFAKTVAGEQIALGRFGALVDVATSPSGVAQSYAVGYSAENIIDWTVVDIDGFYKITRVLLREFERVDADQGASADNPWIGAGRDVGGRPNSRRSPRAAPSRFTTSYTFKTIYRELVLEPVVNGAGEIIGRVYRQYVYDEDPTGQPREVYEPKVRGNPLPFIPFVFFGSGSNAADCEKPPLLDIVDLNLKHYRTYAELEHGRFYTAMPVYYAPGNNDNDASAYHIGPSTVWEVPEGQVPGIVEFKGEGLKTLERALNEKEQQIAAIGGRLMPGMSKSVSESDNQSAMREANEQSLLLNVIMSLEEGMTLLVRFWLLFRDVPMRQTETLRYELDTTFLTTAVDARTLRAIQQLFEGGLLPIDALYENFVRNGLVPSSTTLDEFSRKMKDPNSFIGQPDAVAARRGFVNRAQELEQARLAREADFAQHELDLEERRVALDERKLAIAEKVDSTSVSAQRKLGDPEQAEPSKAESEMLANQRQQAKAAAKTATPPKPAPPRAPKKA